MKYILLILIGISCQSQAFAQAAIRTLLKLPDTGQQKSYTNTFGEDADYSISPPNLIKNSDGTVTDSVTGLMWTMSDGGEMTIENAQLWVNSLRTGGHADWRLPTPLESFSILNLDATNPALDQSKFQVNATEYWWTQFRQAGDTTKIWVTNAGGGIGNHPKKETISAGGNKVFAARAVRSLHADIYLLERFQPLPGGLLLDSMTDLLWIRYPAADSMTWEQALNCADTSIYGGFQDWRLPNIKELMSLTDYTVTNPALNRKYLSASGNIHLWSSTSLPNQPQRAWYLDTKFGITTYADKTSRQSVWLVRSEKASGTGIAKAAASETLATPNPFGSQLYYSGKMISIQDLHGKYYFSGNINQYINTASWPSGVYILSEPETGRYLKLVHVAE